MRIDKLTIKSSWKNLSGFSVDFDESRDVAVLIGKNGSAKSNLLEAIIRIFRDIDLGEVSPFAYEIKYHIHDKRVLVEADQDKIARAKVDDKTVSLQDLQNAWTPKYVVSYYSGTSDRFDELYQKHDRQALGETLISVNHISINDRLEFRRFIYARPIHGLFALLSFYLSDDKEVVNFLQDYPRIEAFDSVLLILKKPDWAKTADGPDKFWGAKGPVRNLLETFKRHSLAPFARTVSVPRDFRRRKTTELLYLYLPDLKSLYALAKEYGRDPRAFFQALDTMRLSDLISDFRVRIRVKGAANAIHTRQLSEGEQQLLTVIGLMRFTRNAGSLYLLDEPDTHLNPEWGLEYLDRLRKIGGIERESHTFIATHDPLLVAGLVKQEIRALYRSENGKIVAVEPDESPRGTGVARVLTSQLYGLESQLDQFSLRVLKRIYEVSMMKDYSRRERHLSCLRRLVPSLTPTESFPDPYRNIAKLAYNLANDLVLQSTESQDWKRNAVEQLASRLFKEAGEAKG